MALLAKPQLDGDLLVIYTDGGSRGNPGPAASGWTIGGLPFGKYIGITTNNDAEYQAIVMSLHQAKSLLGQTKAKQTRVEVRMDSELACKQLNHEYRLKDPQIQKHFIEIWNSMLDFKEVKFVHVRREFNKEADAAVNKALDEWQY
jgi:ribonuclease HI